MSWWYRKSVWVGLLLPLSWIYKFIISIRRYLYKCGIFRVHAFDVPVIIVGNITVGGTGKTPFVAALVKILQQQGYKPGIVSRGYGGKSKIWPCIVESGSDPKQVGDEAVMLVRQTQAAMVVDPNRPRAVKKLLEKFDCDIVVSDDGLQHYALNRDLEIVVIDHKRGFGNEYCLPAGPLRESLSRLLKVDYVIQHYPDEKSYVDSGMMSFYLKPKKIYNIIDSSVLFDLEDARDKVIHAVCGIGHPRRFFDNFIKFRIFFCAA